MVLNQNYTKFWSLVKSTLSWLYSVGSKFACVVPFCTFFSVLVNLVSQVSLIFAFFLPLKVIILLGSSNIPGYFPIQLKELGIDRLTIYLSVLSVIFYLLYLLMERIFTFFSNKGAEKILDKSNKVALFENQSEIATHSYQKYTRGLSGLFFFTISLAVVLVLYPVLGFLVFLYVAIIVLLSGVISTYSEKITEFYLNNIGAYLKTLTAVGFLLTFIFIVFDFLHEAPPDFIIAILSLLLVRQALTRISSFFSDVVSLYPNRHKINALFFHGAKFFSYPVEKVSDMWKLLDPEKRQIWVKDVLSGVLGERENDLSMCWFELGIANVGALNVRYLDNAYLVKVFDKNRSAWACHEASLLSSMPVATFPSAKLLGVADVQGLNCHVFDITGLRNFDIKERRGALYQFSKELFMANVPDEIVKRYRRSHPVLWERLNISMVNRLNAVVSDREEKKCVKYFEEQFEEFISTLQELPLILVNPEVKAELLLRDEAGKTIALNWGRWVLEPIGSNWLVRDDGLMQLEKALLSVSNGREDLKKIEAKNVSLSCLLYAFERQYVRQRYSVATQYLREVFNLFNK